MSTALAPAISAQIEALCATIAADPEIQSARNAAETFLADEGGVSLYREVMTLGRTLEQRHRSGAELEPTEVNRFQDLQEQADQHDGIQSFMAAQDKLQNLANTLNTFIAKTLEKGSVPAAEEVMGSGCCGGGCGCK
ncbi:MAG: YlbF family regulator [Verrucomicrobiota bacterium]